MKEILAVLSGSFKDGVMIAFFVFIMMMIIDYLNIMSKGIFAGLIRGKRSLQYVITSFLGVTPGCLGAFMNVSFYMRGLVSFGAVAGGMMATSGDEAFIMLSLFPEKALVLFAVQFIVGIIAGFAIDKTVRGLKMQTCPECATGALHEDSDCRILGAKEIWRQLGKMSLNRFLLLGLTVGAMGSLAFGVIGPETWDWKRVTFLSLMAFAVFVIVTVPDHYLVAHIWEHIFKKHLWKIFLWSFGVITVMDIGLRYLDVEAFIRGNMIWILLFSGLVGLVPESGPHLVFVMLFSRGLVPFSVLLTSSIVQDGHGMIPMLSYSLRDSIKMKLFNLTIGLALGTGLYLLNL